MAGPYAPSDSRNYVGIGRQTVRGTGVAPATFVAYLPSPELDHGMSINKIKEAGAAGKVTYAEKVSHLPSGKFTALARPVLTTKLSAYLFGVDTPGAAVSGVTPHVITDDFVTDYLCVEVNLADEAPERFIDCALTELAIACDRGNPTLRVNGSWVGGEPDWRASATAESYETDRAFLISDGTFTVDGGAVTNVTKLSMVMKMTLSLEQTQDVTPEFVVKLGSEVDIVLEQITSDISAEYRKALYGAVGNTAVQKTATSGSFIADFGYGAAGTARGWKLEVPNLDYYTAVYTNANPDGGEAVKVTRTMSARAVAGTVLGTITGRTTDAGAYVT